MSRLVTLLPSGDKTTSKVWRFSSSSNPPETSQNRVCKSRSHSDFSDSLGNYNIFGIWTGLYYHLFIHVDIQSSVSFDRGRSERLRNLQCQNSVRTTRIENASGREERQLNNLLWKLGWSIFLVGFFINLANFLLLKNEALDVLQILIQAVGIVLFLTALALNRVR